MTESTFALAIRGTAATKLAIERAAASSGVSVSQFVEATMARVLVDDYIESAAGERIDEMVAT
jgi:uncharacterized protein (DUF1778 family)